MMYSGQRSLAAASAAAASTSSYPYHASSSQLTRPPNRRSPSLGPYTRYPSSRQAAAISTAPTTSTTDPYYRSASADYYRYPASYRTTTRGYTDTTGYSGYRSASRQRLLDYSADSRTSGDYFDSGSRRLNTSTLSPTTLRGYSHDYPLDRYSSRDYYNARYPQETYSSQPKSASTDIYPSGRDRHYSDYYDQTYNGYLNDSAYSAYPRESYGYSRYSSRGGGGYFDSTGYSNSYPRLNDYSTSYYRDYPSYSDSNRREYSRSYPTLDYSPRDYYDSTGRSGYSRDYYSRGDYTDRGGYSDYYRSTTARDYSPDVYPTKYQTSAYSAAASRDYPSGSSYNYNRYSSGGYYDSTGYPITRCQSAPIPPYTADYYRDYSKDYRYSEGSYNRAPGYSYSYDASQSYPNSRCQSAPPPYQYPAPTSASYQQPTQQQSQSQQYNPANPSTTKPKSIMRSGRSSSYAYESPYGYSNPGAQASSYSTYGHHGVAPTASSSYEHHRSYDRGGGMYGGTAASSAQHNHPPYYGSGSTSAGQTSGYHSGQYGQQQSHYGSSDQGYQYQNGYLGHSATTTTHHQQPTTHISAASYQPTIDPHYHSTSSAYPPAQPPPPPASSQYNPYHQTTSQPPPPPQIQSAYQQQQQQLGQMPPQQSQQQLQQQQMQPKPPLTNPYTIPPSSLALKNPAAPIKNPFGPGGPYGLDASNLDYYRKLYYPYDPITGEYMKDATPPNDTANPTVGGLRPGDIAGMTAEQRALYLRSQAAQGAGAGGVGIAGGLGGATGAHTHYGAIGGGGSAMGGTAFMDGTAGGQMGLVSSQYGYGVYEQEPDSLLLCCDFLIPRPSITCLIITLFVMLVLIIIFTVVKFTIIYPADASNAETLILVDQIVVILLVAAVCALLWIFAIYFTSRRTRRQISHLLSCATGGHGLEHTLVADYDGYVYANSTGTRVAPGAGGGLHNHSGQQQQQQHSHSARGGGALGLTGMTAATTTTGRGATTSTNYGNYRYANNFV